MNKYLIILVFAGLFSACGAQPEPVDTGAVQTAIAQTLMADWTATFTPRPTNTITPTWTLSPTSTDTPTPTPIPTDTPTLTPSPTPDLRVIEISLVDFMLSASDLPAEAGYTIGERQIPFYGNTVYYFTQRDITGIDTGSLGLESSAFLIDDFNGGWLIRYERGISTPIYPQTIAGTVVSFHSVEGARLMMSDYSPCTHQDSEYTLVETALQIGNATQYCTNTHQDTGGFLGTYALVFSYHNFYHAIEAYGWEREVPLDMLEGVARNLLAKLEAAPLSDAVTVQP